MAYSQYSKTTLNEDEHSTAGSSSFSNWQHLLASNPRKRALGRVKVTALPQRMSAKSPERPPASVLANLPQRMSAKSPERSSNMLPQPQRLSPPPSAPRSPLLNMRPQRLSPAPSGPRSPLLNMRPQRMSRKTPEKYPMPQRLTSTLVKTPEMPQLKSVNFSPSTHRKANKSPIRHANDSSRSRSQSTPPVMKRNPVQQAQVQPPAPPPPEDLSRPTIIVNSKVYYMVDRIGKGGSSDVFQVLEAKGSRMRAIKRVDLSDVSEAEAAAFRNEVKLLERLKGNRRIITLIDYEERAKPNGCGTELFVVLEHGERDLANLLREVSASENGLTNTKTKFYWEEMLEAVSVVHAENIVHSDLKPANFLIVGGMLKLIDFGIASAVSDNKTHVTKDNLMGTFNFMSPEAIRDLNGHSNDEKSIVKIGFKSDVWSLGCILYNLVYKKLPFGDIRNPLMKVQAIMNPDHPIKFPQDPTSLGGHDPQVVEVLKRCLERDVPKRASIEELLHHSYLKSKEKSNGAAKQHLAVDQLLNAIATLTPNSKKVVMENLTNTSKLSLQQPPQYSNE